MLNSIRWREHFEMKEVKYYSDHDGNVDDDDEDDGSDYGDNESDSEQYNKKKKRTLVSAILQDDVHKFFVILKSMFEEDVKPYMMVPRPCPRFVLKWICSSVGGAKCATALLQRQTETCVLVDLNVPFYNGQYPLHGAASVLNYNMVDLFLRYGARADVVNEDTMDSNSLPLNTALEMFNYHKFLYDWVPEESIYKLIIILCLPQMKVGLETNRLLALSTQYVYELFIDYAKKGKLVEMAILLLVANERIMARSTCRNKAGAIVGGGMTIRDIILQADKESEVLVCNGEKRNKIDLLFKDKRTVFTLILLRIFERTGDALRSYLRSQHNQVPKVRVVKEVASILKKAGFVLKDKDIDLSNIDCESDEIKKFSGTSENISAYDSKFYIGMFCSKWSVKVNKIKRQKDLGVKDVASILEETGFMLNGNDIDLSNIDCDSDAIKEVAGTSTFKLEKCSKKLHNPLNDIFLNAKLNPIGWPPNLEVYRGKTFNPVRSFSSSSDLLESHCFRPFSNSAVLQLQKNKGEKNTRQQLMQPSRASAAVHLQKYQFKGEKNVMQRLSKSSSLLASLALSFKRGIRRG